MSAVSSFAGFTLPNAIPIPEEVWQLLPDLGGAEVKVLLFLFYKTLGFRKRQDAVALSQITAGTGLSRPTVVEAIRRLEERGCLEVIQAVTPEGVREANIYRPHFRGEGVVKKVNHPPKEIFGGVVKKVDRHDIHAAATAAERDAFFRFFREFSGREMTADEIAMIGQLEGGIPEGVIREGIERAFRSRRRSDRPPTVGDCVRLIRRLHRKHHPGNAGPAGATGDAGAAALAVGEAAGAPFPAAISAPGVPDPGAFSGLVPVVAEPLPAEEKADPLGEIWAALGECGCDTPPVRRGIRLLAFQHPPEALYRAVVEALAYGVSPQRLLGYVRSVLERMAAEAASEVGAGAGGTGDLSDSPGLEAGVAGVAVGGDRGDGEAGRLWEQVLGELQLELTRATFDTWLRPTRAVGREEGVLVVQVASVYAREWLESRLQGMVERALERVAGEPLRVRFVVGEGG
jgi:DNA-binding Lrp family transcriptional regulator